MAETLETVPTVTIKESIARVELFTDAKLAPDNWMLVIHFETNAYDASGALVAPGQWGSRVVRRRFGDIKTDAVPSSNTVATLAAAIQAACYTYRAADIAAAAQPPEGAST